MSQATRGDIKLAQMALVFFLFSGVLFLLLSDKYDFESRKKMVMVLNNIDNSSPSVDAKLNNGIINVLIEEELLNQHAASVGGKITSTQIDNAISTIEQRNNMPNGGMAAFMKERGLQMESFKKQIAGEIIKHNIVSSLSNSVSVSPLELDVAVINTDMPKFNIEAWIFTSKGNLYVIF